MEVIYVGHISICNKVIVSNGSHALRDSNLKKQILLHKVFVLKCS